MGDSHELAAKVMTFGGGLGSTISGAFAFLNENAAGIGALFAILGFAVSVAGFIWIRRLKKLEIEIAKERLKTIRERI